MELLQQLQGWQGNRPALTRLLATLFTDLLSPEYFPSVSTLKYWHLQGIIDNRESRRLTEREALQSCAAMLLKRAGYKLPAIRKRVASRSIKQLRGLVDQLINETLQEQQVRSSQIDSDSQGVVFSLASGIVQLYHQVVLGGKIVRQRRENLPHELLNALSRLGRLYIEAGQEDQAASVHQVLARSRQPLQAWGLPIFTDPHFPFRDCVLIDPDLYVPTTDCLEIAQAHGGNTADILEHESFERLQEIAQAAGSKANRVYTLMREFIGRFSLTTYYDDILVYMQQHMLPNEALLFLANEVYMEIPEAWLIDGHAFQCGHCHTLLRPDPRQTLTPYCPMRACRDLTSSTTMSAQLDARKARVVKPHLLSYWVNPAIDELRIYDAANAAGVPATLYPDMDRCDVSL